LSALLLCSVQLALDLFELWLATCRNLLRNLLCDLIVDVFEVPPKLAQHLAHSSALCRLVLDQIRRVLSDCRNRRSGPAVLVLDENAYAQRLFAAPKRSQQLAPTTILAREADSLLKKAHAQRLVVALLFHVGSTSRTSPTTMPQTRCISSRSSRACSSAALNWRARLSVGFIFCSSRRFSKNCF